jgi:hypothetical protein
VSDDFHKTRMGAQVLRARRAAHRRLARGDRRATRAAVRQRVWIVRTADDFAVFPSEQGCRVSLAEDGVDVGAWDGQSAVAIGGHDVFTKIVIP